MVREIKAAPLLFGYRGSEEVSTSARSSGCCCRLAAAQERPAPGAVPRPEPGAGERGRRLRAHRPGPGRGGHRPAVGWFARRLSTMPGDTLTGGSGDCLTRGHRARLSPWWTSEPRVPTGRATWPERSRSTGYYPEVVADAVYAAVAGEEVVAFVVHHEPTFDHDEVRRHLIGRGAHPEPADGRAHRRARPRRPAARAVHLDLDRGGAAGRGAVGRGEPDTSPTPTPTSAAPARR